MTVLALAALAAGLSAQDLTLENAMSGLGKGNVPVPSVSAPADVAPQAVPAASSASREWLFLVFVNGVNDLGIQGYADKDINEMEQVGSSDRMAVVVEYNKLGMDDPFSGNLQMQRGTRTVYVNRDADTTKITSPQALPPYTKSVDMGSARHLMMFARRAIARFPARKVAIVVWNHGAGQNGVSFDDVSGNHMEIDQLGEAMGQIAQALGHKVDLLAFDACRMQMASVAYEMKDSVGVVVGSEENIPGDGYPYNAVLGALAANPGMGAEDFGRAIVAAYVGSYRADATLSAVRTSALPGFVTGMNSWVAAVKADPAAFAVAADPALVSATSHFSNPESRDLVDYLSRVNAALPAGSRARTVGSALIGFTANRVLIAKGARPASSYRYTAANGLAIYIPDLRYDSANDSKFAFASDSQWDDFLVSMLGSRK